MYSSLVKLGHNVLKSVVRWEKGERDKMLLYSLCVLPRISRSGSLCIRVYIFSPPKSRIASG